jgi:hypothetical protein
MTIALEKPTVDAVTAACERFDEENRSVEDALKKLFGQYQKNAELSEVLLKVTAVNALYSTQILQYGHKRINVLDIASRIVELGIDPELEKGSPDVVFQIARISVAGKKNAYNYSFATKYCNWHQHSHYPISDARVREYLWNLRSYEWNPRDYGCLGRFQQKRLWDYPIFTKIVSEFQRCYGLEDFNFKQIDMFMYYEGGKLLAAKENVKQSASTIESQQNMPEVNEEENA